MKKLLIPVICSFLFLAIIFSSCSIGETSAEAQSIAEEFYGYLSDKNYDKAMELVDEESKTATDGDQWLMVLSQKEGYGKFLGFEKDIGFNTNYNNGTTTVKLNYTCDYEKFTLYEHFVMVKRGNLFKVMFYEYNTNKSLLSD
jgi:hypothetical protein